MAKLPGQLEMLSKSILNFQPLQSTPKPDFMMAAPLSSCARQLVSFVRLYKKEALKRLHPSSAFRLSAALCSVTSATLQSTR